MSGEVYIVSGCRTAIGAFGGTLKDVRVADLGAVVVREALARAGLRGEDVDEVVLGCILAAGQGQNVARQAALAAGVPVSVPASAINMLCGSGMRAVVDAARAILAGDADVVVAGGMESMSSAPFVAPAARWGARLGDAVLQDTLIHDALTDAFFDYHMGITAENVADRFSVTREAMDELALRSQTRAAAAIAGGVFAPEIVPVSVPVKRDTVSFEVDEHPRATSAEALARLKPAFRPDGRVTAGNSSGINDGAAALVVASQAAVDRFGLTPMARLTGWGQAGVDPAIMGIGPVDASRRALARAGVGVADLDLIEANEAFAAQAAAVAGELGFDDAKLNVNGGAIALGHPVGASAARIIVTLLYELGRRPQAKTGLATACIGGGMGIAAVFVKC
jgi:acetyl-CoA C-acetyltransferase